MTIIKVEFRNRIFEFTLFDLPEKDRAFAHILIGFSKATRVIKLFSADLFFIRLFRNGV